MAQQGVLQILGNDLPTHYRGTKHAEVDQAVFGALML